MDAYFWGLWAAAQALPAIVMVFAPMRIYTQARQKGYRAFGGVIICASAMIAGALGAVLWYQYGWRLLSQEADILVFLSIIPAIAIAVSTFYLHCVPSIAAHRESGTRRVTNRWSRRLFLLGCMLLVASVAALHAFIANSPASFLAVLMGPYVGGILGCLALAFAAAQWVAERTIGNYVSFEDFLGADSRALVLFIRPFKLDYYIFASSQNRNYTFESYFFDELSKIGPFVALGSPEEYAPPVIRSAFRIYASDATWVSRLVELAHRSCCIVAEMATAENLEIEFGILRREELQGRLFIINGHPDWTNEIDFRFIQRVVRFGKIHMSWEDFANNIRELGYDVDFQDPGMGSVLTFDERGHGILLATGASTPAGYIDPINAWIERRQKIGRCISATCLSCGNKFHVFPADIVDIRPSWCIACEDPARGNQGAVMKFVHRHMTSIVVSFMFVALFTFPVIWYLISESPWLRGARGLFALAGLGAGVCGVVYLQKKIASRNNSRLVMKYEELAEAGDVVAMANLGMIWRLGIYGVFADQAKAEKWLRKAAEAGDIGGMINLARLCEAAVGRPLKPDDEAIRWYTKAAEAGSCAAKQVLDRMDILF